MILLCVCAGVLSSHLVVWIPPPVCAFRYRVLFAHTTRGRSGEEQEFLLVFVFSAAFLLPCLSLHVCQSGRRFPLATSDLCVFSSRKNRFPLLHR